MEKNQVLRMDNVGIVVASLENAIAFFEELGMILQGRSIIDGDWSGRVTGLKNQQVEIAMMTTPDGNNKIELCRYISPQTISDHRTAPVNSLGYLRIMFAVNDLEDTLDRLKKHGASVLEEIVNYQNIYKLCYLRGPEGILIGLAEALTK